MPAAVFDLDRAWQVHPRVSIRPEPFGALVYHFETRKRSFLKERALLGVVEGLDGVCTALAALAASSMLVESAPALSSRGPARAGAHRPALIEHDWRDEGNRKRADISNALLHLVSESGRLVTGTTHIVDAGGQF